MRLPFVHVNGIDMFYESHGEGEPLFLIHGAFGTHETHWRTQVPFFSEHFRVVSMDLRGHGVTANPTDELSVEMFAADIAEMISALRLKPAHIFGFSLGAVIALFLCIQHHDLARSLVLWGVNHQPDRRFLERIAQEHQLLENPEHSASLRRQHSAYGSKNFDRLSHQLKREAFRRRSFMEEEIRKIECPTLVCHGDRDEFVNLDLAVSLYRMLPKGALHVIPGSGHILSASRMETFNRVVLDFLLSTGQRS